MVVLERELKEGRRVALGNNHMSRLEGADERKVRWIRPQRSNTTAKAKSASKDFDDSQHSEPLTKFSQ